MKQVRPKKNLGQHFLTDLTIARRIADTVDVPYPELPVLEVGPGMGVMTQFLAEKPRLLKVVEIDRESVEYLEKRFCGRDSGDSGERSVERGERIPSTMGEQNYSLSSLLSPLSSKITSPLSYRILSSESIISGDFLRMDLHTLFDGGQFVLTGNYPYDISSQIFFKMLDNRDLIPCCTGMIQHEVALRLAAQPGSKQYGILSVLIQAWYDVEYLFTVAPSVFNPPPKVQSAVIRMVRNDVQQLGCDEQLFKRVVKTTFNQRRKMLRVSLRQLLPPESSLFTTHPSLLTRRPEQLAIPEFVELTNLVEQALAGQ